MEILENQKDHSSHHFTPQTRSKKYFLSSISHFMQTEDLGEISDPESCDDDEKGSVFKNLYKNCEQIYKKEKAIGTNWLGHR